MFTHSAVISNVAPIDLAPSEPYSLQRPLDGLYPCDILTLFLLHHMFRKVIMRAK